MKRRYTVVLELDPEGGGYTVTVPALPGCVTEADSIEDSLEMAREPSKGTSSHFWCWEGLNTPTLTLPHRGERTAPFPLDGGRLGWGSPRGK